MILEKHIPEELLKTAYWFRASNEHIYLVTLDFNYSDVDGDLKNVVAIAQEADCNYIDNVDVTDIKNGQEVQVYMSIGDWILEVDIWSKYYFPKFNEDQLQWYHKMDEDEADWMDDFSFILKESYKKAVEISGIKFY